MTCEDRNIERNSSPGGFFHSAPVDTSLVIAAEHGFLHGIVKIVNWHRGSMGKLWCQSGDGRGGGNQPSYFSLSVLIAMVEAIRL